MGGTCLRRKHHMVPRTGGRDPRCRKAGFLRRETMKTITRGPRGLGQLIFLAVLFALVADAPVQHPAELIIRNGLIVTADGRTEGDLRIRNGTIAEIGPNLTAAAGARVIEAKGVLVLPGGLDPHGHLHPTRTATPLQGADD